VSADEGGLCADWPDPVVTPVEGTQGNYIDLASSTPDDIPAGAFGPILRFDFVNLPQDAGPALFTNVYAESYFYDLGYEWRGFTMNMGSAALGAPMRFPLAGGALWLEMVYIPPGGFMMGAMPGEQGASISENPQHHVTIFNGFWMSRYELTAAQYKAVMEYDSPYATGDNQPVPAAGRSFLATLNEKTSGDFRLPSEAEWEYACRAGTTTRYYWGDDPDLTLYDNYAWRSMKGHDVGGKLPNAWGLYDMIGNAPELCEDDWHDSYYGAPDDGSPWVDSPRRLPCVMRGIGRLQFSESAHPVL
jgi:hypothetical protein